MHALDAPLDESGAARNQNQELAENGGGIWFERDEKLQK